MNLIKCTKNVKCDMADCRNHADYYVESEKRAYKATMFLCLDCMEKLHSSIGKIITPKSPKNMLNNTDSIKKTRKKLNEK